MRASVWKKHVHRLNMRMCLHNCYFHWGICTLLHWSIKQQAMRTRFNSIQYNKYFSKFNMIWGCHEQEHDVKLTWILNISIAQCAKLIYPWMPCSFMHESWFNHMNWASFCWFVESKLVANTFRSLIQFWDDKNAVAFFDSRIKSINFVPGWILCRGKSMQNALKLKMISSVPRIFFSLCSAVVCFSIYAIWMFTFFIGLQ